MPVNSILPPYPIWQEIDGSPLENGYIYIGNAGFEARSTPKASFFDKALTIPTGTASGAAVRTMRGFPVRNGAPTMIYVDDVDWSVTVTDRNGVVIYSAINRTFEAQEAGAGGPILAPDGNLVAAGFGFTNETDTGFSRPATATLQEAVDGTLVRTATPTLQTFAVPVATTTSATVSAGTNAQGQGPLVSDNNLITTVASNPGGVTLPTAVAGRNLVIVNAGANTLNVYPATGAAINGGAVNTPVTLRVGQTLRAVALSATAWRASVVAPIITSTDTIAANNTDLVVPTSAAVKAYADGLAASGEGGPTTASGTSVSFTGIPSTARRITIFFNAVSLSGTDDAIVQIGTGGTAETTGYDGNGAVINNGVSPATGAIGNGFFLALRNAANGLYGSATLTKEPGTNTWHASFTLANQASGMTLAGGRKSLAGVLDMFRVIPTGANTFDGGAISYRWEV